MRGCRRVSERRFGIPKLAVMEIISVPSIKAQAASLPFTSKDSTPPNAFAEL